jgi:hypothetical protein
MLLLLPPPMLLLLQAILQMSSSSTASSSTAAAAQQQLERPPLMQQVLLHFELWLLLGLCQHVNAATATRQMINTVMTALASVAKGSSACNRLWCRDSWHSCS